MTAARCGAASERQTGAVNRARFFVAALALLGALAGCIDQIYGIRRAAEVSEQPSLECIEAAIRSVDGIEDVRHEARQGGRTLTLTGLRPGDELYYFAYTSGEVGATLLVTIDHEGNVTLDQHKVSVNRPVPREELEAVRPLMIRIEAAIEERCGVPHLTESVKEWREE